MSEVQPTWDGLHCLDCGYDLTGIETGVCPECAAALDRPLMRRVEELWAFARVGSGLDASILLLLFIIALGSTWDFAFCAIVTLGIVVLAYGPLALVALAPRCERRRWCIAWLLEARWLSLPIAPAILALSLWMLCLLWIVLIPLLVLGPIVGWFVWYYRFLARLSALGLSSTSITARLLIIGSAVSPIVVYLAYLYLLFVNGNLLARYLPLT
jgi:hypothetical protein